MDWFELIKVVLATFLAGGLSYYLTPIVRRAALRFGIVDAPDGRLKHQEEPVAYLGGLSIFIALLTTISLAYHFDTVALGILLGTSLIIVLGIIDDFGVLSPKIKLLGQMIAVWALYKAGISVQITWLPDWLNVIITFIWVLGITNALNLIDVMDGLASGIGAMAAVFLAFVSFNNGHYLLAAFPLILAGSLYGFLPHNFKPATIYLGDTGSMAIGFVLAALTLHEQYTLYNPGIGVLAPIVILGVPVFETAFLVIVRLAKGMHPLQGSPDHFALRLKRRGWPVQRIVLAAYAGGAVCGGLGMLIVYADTVTAIGALAAYAILALMFSGYLLTEELGSRSSRKGYGKG